MPEQKVVPRPTLDDGVVTLRAPWPRDRDDRLRIGRDAEFVRMVGGDDRDLSPMTSEEVDRWYAGVAADTRCWVIDVDGVAIGTVRFSRLDRETRVGRMAIGIFVPEQWNLGYGTRSTRLVVRYGFEALALARIELRVLADNPRAIAAYERCGFVRGRIDRDVEQVAGRWLSDLWMSIDAARFRAISAAWPLRPASVPDA